MNTLDILTPNTTHHLMQMKMMAVDWCQWAEKKLLNVLHLLDVLDIKHSQNDNGVGFEITCRTRQDDATLFCILLELDLPKTSIGRLKARTNKSVYSFIKLKIVSVTHAGCTATADEYEAVLENLRTLNNYDKPYLNDSSPTWYSEYSIRCFFIAHKESALAFMKGANQ